MSNKSLKIQEKELKRFCKQVLLQIGLTEKHSEIVSETLVNADLRGVHSHGTIRFPFYVKRLMDGGTKVEPKIEFIKETDSIGLLDADNGMGQIATYYAMEKAIKKANNTGIGYISIKNSEHFGAAGFYAIQALENEMIGIAMSNTTNNMAPWGGCERKIGNNPLAVAIPADKFPPMVLDISMSKVSGGKVREAKKKEENIPKGWIISQEGKSTNDPSDLEKGGALLPFGDYKGYGLAILIEALTGVLSGSNIMSQIPLWIKETEIPINVGHAVVAIDISKFIDLDNFKKQIDYIINDLKSCRLEKGSKEILYPGEKEHIMEEKQSNEGISLNVEIIKDLNEIAKEFNVSFVG